MIGSTRVPSFVRLAGTAALVLATVGPLGAQQQATPTSARLRAGATVPLPPPMAIGGGEVAVDITIDPGGTVSQVAPLRATPPFTDLVVNAVRSWRFDAATAIVEKKSKPAQGHVLVVGVFRPPQVYSTPARGEPMKVVGQPSPEMPQPGTHAMPMSYPPRAVRDGTVLIEIELTAAGVARGHRVMSPASPFDSAALEAVKTWRFGFPAKPTGATQLYVYAIVGFREPIT